MFVVKLTVGLAKLLSEALDLPVRGQLREQLETALQTATGRTKRDLTEQDYDRLKSGKLLDPNRTGFLMRAGPRRGKVWLFRTSDPVSGRQVEIPIGSWPAMSLADARAVWRDMLDQRRQGRLPIKANHTINVEELATLYLDEYARPFKTPDTALQDQRYLEMYVLPDFGKMKATEFSEEMLEPVVVDIAKTKPAAARGLRVVVATMYKLATGKPVRQKRFSWLPKDTPNPAINIPNPQQAGTAERWTPSHAQMLHYFQAIQ